MAYKTREKKINNFVIFIVLAVIIFGIYCPGIGTNYFNDDFKFVFKDPSSKIFHFFNHTNPGIHTYRPFQAMFSALTQVFFGMETWSIQFIQICFHILFCFLLYLFIQEIGFNRLAALIASLYMGINQINAQTVLGNDTFVHLMAALFGALSLLYIYKSQKEETNKRSYKKYYWFALLFFAFSLFMKETAIAFLLIIASVLLIQKIKYLRKRFFWKRYILLVLPFCIIFYFYYVIRSFVVLPASYSTQDVYTIGLGLHVIKNLILQISSAVVPWSSTYVYFSFLSKNVLRIAWIAITSLIFCLSFLYGLLRATNKRILIIISLIGIMALFPTFLLRHVSELYTYTAMPYFSILIGVGLAQLIKKIITRGRKSHIFVMYILVFSLIASQMSAVREKAFLMKRNGERSSEMLQQIKPWLSKIPRGGELILVNQKTGEKEYSLFFLKGFNVIEYGANNILHLIANRNDFGVRIIDETGLSEMSSSQNKLFLSFNNGKVIRFVF